MNNLWSLKLFPIPPAEKQRKQAYLFFILEDKGKSHWIGGDIDSQ